MLASVKVGVLPQGGDLAKEEHGSEGVCREEGRVADLAF